jgi:cytochrome c6
MIKAFLRSVLSAALACSWTATGHAADGKKVFAAKCVACHGADGKGRTPQGKKVHAKDLTASKLGDADITRQIVNGFKDPKGKLLMPSFKTVLTPEEIEAVVKYVKSLRN